MWDNDVGTARVRRWRRRCQGHVLRHCRWNVVASSIDDDGNDGMLVLLVSDAGADVVKGTFRVVVDGTSSHHPSTTTATTATTESGPVYMRDSGLIVLIVDRARSVRVCDRARFVRVCKGRIKMQIEVVHCAGTPLSMLWRSLFRHCRW
jgi:hypothetical protein